MNTTFEFTTESSYLMEKLVDKIAKLMPECEYEIGGREDYHVFTFLFDTREEMHDFCNKIFGV